MQRIGEATPALPSLCPLVAPAGLGAARAGLVPIVTEPQKVPAGKAASMLETLL